MQWIRASEIVAGLVLDSKVSADSIDPSTVSSPYDIAIRMLRDGANESDLLDAVGIHALDIAHKASAALNGRDPLKYIEACEVAAVRVTAGSRLRPIVDKLERGDDVDIASALSAISSLDRGQDRKSTRLNSSHSRASRMPSSA